MKTPKKNIEHLDYPRLDAEGRVSANGSWTSRRGCFLAGAAATGVGSRGFVQPGYVQGSLVRIAMTVPRKFSTFGFEF